MVQKSGVTLTDLQLNSINLGELLPSLQIARFVVAKKLQQEDRAWFLIKLPCGRQELRLIRMVEQILEHGGLEKTFPVQLTE